MHNLQAKREEIKRVTSGCRELSCLCKTMSES